MEPPPQDGLRWLITEERTAFYDSLAPAAKARFLGALEAAATRGLDEVAAWEDAVVAAELTYPPEGPEFDPEAPPLDGKL